MASAPEQESEPGPAPESGPESESDNIGDLESPDSCVLFLEEKRVVVSWRVAQASFARQLEERPEGAPVVRLVWWVPGLPAARHSQDVAVTQAAGELLVEPKSFVPEATLRGALGWAQASGEFVVMATAVVCCLGSEHAVKASELREELTFRPHAAAPPASKERASAARQLMERYA